VARASEVACILYAKVAQSVEHSTENAGVGGSIPPLGTFRFWQINRAASRAALAYPTLYDNRLLAANWQRNEELTKEIVHSPYRIPLYVRQHMRVGIHCDVNRAMP
jgi:hypothetical protein